VNEVRKHARIQLRYLILLAGALFLVLAVRVYLGKIERANLKAATGFYFQKLGMCGMPMVYNRNAPPPLRIRDSDYRRYPRSEFSFSFERSHGFRIDMFRGTVEKDKRDGSWVVEPMQLSAAEMDRIYETVISIRLFDYPEPHPPLGSHRYDGHNSGTWTLTVGAGDTRKTFFWNSGEIPGDEYFDEWARLYHLTDVICEIVVQRPEYAKLPRNWRIYF
jgi:hypothetical protein